MVGVREQFVEQAAPLLADRTDLHGRVAAHHLEFDIAATQRERTDRSFDPQHTLAGGILDLE